MKQKNLSCPVCKLSEYENFDEISTNLENSSKIMVDCENCGKFSIAGNTCKKFISELKKLYSVQKKRVSRRLKSQTSEKKILEITNKTLKELLKNLQFPNVSVQVNNLIRFIGDYIRRSGVMHFYTDISIHELIGAPSQEFVISLLEQLQSKGLISCKFDETFSYNRQNFNYVKEVHLTLDGWDRYESIVSGVLPGNFGFIAMEFEDDTLEQLMNDFVKPAVKKYTGFELKDVREFSRAGVIDNIIRSQIRDSKFVIADLTHDNYGAYWEAGFAEGLGKPVIYICESAKFKKERTHFDTNHCTTVLWNVDDPMLFCNDLIATIRRSLDYSV